MKYAVIQTVNENFSIASEHGENKIGAIVAFHNLCAALWNDTGDVEAVVKLVDTNQDVVDGHVEFISHSATS